MAVVPVHIVIVFTTVETGIVGKSPLDCTGAHVYHIMHGDCTGTHRYCFYHGQAKSALKDGRAQDR
jgi:hypothetical protein